MTCCLWYLQSEVRWTQRLFCLFFCFSLRCLFHRWLRCCEIHTFQGWTFHFQFPCMSLLWDFNSIKINIFIPSASINGQHMVENTLFTISESWMKLSCGQVGSRIVWLFSIFPTQTFNLVSFRIVSMRCQFPETKVRMCAIFLWSSLLINE